MSKQIEVVINEIYIERACVRVFVCVGGWVWVRVKIVRIKNQSESETTEREKLMIKGQIVR